MHCTSEYVYAIFRNTRVHPIFMDSKNFIHKLAQIIEDLCPILLSCFGRNTVGTMVFFSTKLFKSVTRYNCIDCLVFHAEIKKIHLNE